MDCNFLEKTILFREISVEEIRKMLDCLEAKEQAYQKGSVIFREGDVTETMGLVLSGTVRIENNDIWGNKSILDSIGAGQVFAETYACVPGEAMMVSAVAAEDCRILMLNAQKMLQDVYKRQAVSDPGSFFSEQPVHRKAGYERHERFYDSAGSGLSFGTDADFLSDYSGNLL